MGSQSCITSTHNTTDSSGVEGFPTTRPPLSPPSPAQLTFRSCHPLTWLRTRSFYSYHMALSEPLTLVSRGPRHMSARLSCSHPLITVLLKHMILRARLSAVASSGAPRLGSCMGPVGPLHHLSSQGLGCLRIQKYHFSLKHAQLPLKHILSTLFLMSYLKNK